MIEEAQRLLRDHVLMRDVFHCTPFQLDLEDEADLVLHWAIREALRQKEKAHVQ